MRSPPALRLLSMALARDLAALDWPRETLGPEGPPRGVPVFDPASCIGCGDCVGACPAGCLLMEDGDGTPVVDAGSCVRCGLCVEACGEGAVSLTGSGVLAAHSREDLVMDGSPPREVSTGPPPSRLYRMAVDGRDRSVLEPRALLDRRSSRLLRRGGGSGEG